MLCNLHELYVEFKVRYLTYKLIFKVLDYEANGESVWEQVRNILHAFALIIYWDLSVKVPVNYPEVTLDE